MQLDCPLLAWNAPAAQLVQAAEPDEAEYLPAAQLEHAVAAAGENVPAGQITVGVEHAEAPELEPKPTEQSVHEVEPEVP